MKIILEAEVMGHSTGMESPRMYPDHCAVRLTVTLRQGSTDPGDKFEQQVIFYQDEVQSTFDLLMKNLTRNMRDVLISYLENRSYLEKFPLMPVLTFQKMRR
jgi:hypothetical protein